MRARFRVRILGPRGEEWQRVLGRAEFGVLSPAAVLLDSPAGRRPHYLLDLAELSAAERQRLEQHLAAKFGLSLAEVRREVAERGVPILADDCHLVALDAGRLL